MNEQEARIFDKKHHFSNQVWIIGIKRFSVDASTTCVLLDTSSAYFNNSCDI